MTKLAALIFDVDGTLADTERDGHRPAFNTAFSEAGLDWDWTVDLYGELLAITGGKERIRHYIDNFSPILPESAHADLDGFIAGLHLAKNRHYAQLLGGGKIPLRPGVRRLLDAARAAGMRLAISTTTSPENVIALLDHTLGGDSASWFEVIAAGDVVPAKKPAPDIYHYAMQAMGLAPEQCLAFEDSENGLKSAVGAGLRTIVTVNEYTESGDFPDAVLVVDHLGEPDRPMRVLTGNAHGATCVDMDLLGRL
ncbi:MAG: HAD family hydrolase [Gammaproteobacteria bacterium]